MQDFYAAVNLTLEINPRNDLIKALYRLHKKDPGLAKDLADQVKLALFSTYLLVYSMILK